MTTAQTYLRRERLASRSNEARVKEAHERAQQAVGRAKTMLRLTIQMAVSAVNDELDHVPDMQAIARACILKDDQDSTVTTIEQYMDDLLSQPMQLLSREAGEE